jgi:Xaa-Pro aminopeptidase
VASDRSAARRAALAARFDHLGVDGLVVSHAPNVRYLTGFTGTAGVAVVLRNESVLVTDFRYRTQAETELDAAVRLESSASDVWERVTQMLDARPETACVGFEAHVVSMADAERVTRRGGRYRLKPVAGAVEALREAKEPEEVAAIRAAARLAAEAFAAALEGVRPGLRERDVAVALEAELRRRGSEWHPFPTIVASGERSALPHARTSDRVIERGDLLLLDFGARVDGYCADITRTVIVGARADERQRAVYDLVREAQARARSGIRAGMTGREADALARSVIEARGFSEAFGHSLGHGLGLEVHEAPRLSRVNDQPVPVHAVVTVEPGAYFPGWGGVRVEDDVYLGPAGPELLSDGETELRELL